MKINIIKNIILMENVHPSQCGYFTIEMLLRLMGVLQFD